MPRCPICEARELLDKVLVADPGSAGGWRPTWSAWSMESGCRSASRRRQSPGPIRHRPHALPVSLEASGQQRRFIASSSITATNAEPAVKVGPPAPFPE
jgi:hypothetical protein